MNFQNVRIAFFLGVFLATLNANAAVMDPKKPEPEGCVDCFNFAAPLVNDASTVNPAQVGQIVYDTSDDIFKGYSAQGSWANLSNQLIEIVTLKDIKSSGVNGGTATGGQWAPRELNDIDPSGSFVSLSSNQFTLQPGTYYIEASAPGHDCDYHRIRLRNVTDSSDQILGDSQFMLSTGGESVTNATLKGRIVLTSIKTFQIEHRVAATKNGTGYGVAANFGVDEVYTTVKIIKLN